MAHQFDPSILREYDIRGIVGDTLDAADARAIGQAFGTMVIRNGGSRVCIGYDGRLSSPELEAAVVDGLMASGIEAMRIGLGPTPMLYFSVYHLQSDGGIMITGSHNPPDYNGFKMMLGTKPFFGAQIQELGKLAAADDLEQGSGSETTVSIFDDYVDRLARDFSGQPLKVAWDAGNGAAGAAVEALCDRLAGEHHLLYTDIDGTFPNHHPDPTVESTLADLKALVKEKGLDLGIAFDGDGDRIGAVDGQGRVVWGDQLLAIMARDVLKEVPGATIIADVKASQVLFDDVAAHGGKPMMWKTGHSLIKSKMAEMDCPLAGEMSGHIFFKHNFYGFDDAIYAGVRLLNSVAAQGGSLAALKDGLPGVLNTPELRFDCDEDRKFAVPQEVLERLRSLGANVSDVDGVRVTTDDGWWLLRASNTQAVLVARCEAADEAGLRRLKAMLVEQLEASGIAPPADL